MKRSIKVFTVCLALLSVLAVGAYSKKAPARVEPPQQFPIADMVAAKVIQKYQQATCEQLWQKKSNKTPPTAEQQQAIAVLKGDPEMRTYFINKISPAIVNKMFDCGMIP